MNSITISLLKMWQDLEKEYFSRSSRFLTDAAFLYIAEKYFKSSELTIYNGGLVDNFNKPIAKVVKVGNNTVIMSIYKSLDNEVDLVTYDVYDKNNRTLVSDYRLYVSYAKINEIEYLLKYGEEYWR